MPVICAIPLRLKTAEVLRQQGLKKRAEGYIRYSLREIRHYKVTR